MWEGLTVPRQGKPVLPPFIAIDFETANNDRASACSIGLVRVEEGKIVARESHLLRPRTRNFELSWVHGLTLDSVKDAPSFAEVWSQLQRTIRGTTFMAAHCSWFDEDVLFASCRRARLPFPAFPTACTRRISKHVLGMRPADLPTVCHRLRIPLNHHDALSDALAAAKIVLAASRHGGTEVVIDSLRDPRH
jgi:DNA polymerase-3 subunit epsilon